MANVAEKELDVDVESKDEYGVVEIVPHNSTITTLDYLAAALRKDKPQHSVVVTNTGTYTGDCVVTAFVLATPGSPSDTPVKKMFGFERLKAMQPGEVRTVDFYPDPSQLSVVDAGKNLLLHEPLNTTRGP